MTELTTPSSKAAAALVASSAAGNSLASHLHSGAAWCFATLLLVGCGSTQEPAEHQGSSEHHDVEEAGSAGARATVARGEPADIHEIRPGQPFVVVLGVGQDGGYPQAGMTEEAAWAAPERRRLPSSLAIVDPESGERWMIEATPAFPEQLRLLDRIAPARAAAEGAPGLSGILLTHAHVGHYAGLIHLGREIIGASRVPVYAMSGMRDFLRSNGPWDQLVRLENIELRALEEGVATALNARIRITPLRVPHRDEYSETVGYVIEGPERSVFFLPDIDKWEEWDARGTRIEEVVGGVDLAWLDATFFADGEVPGRAMSEIPHPFVQETMERFAPLPAGERGKVRFIHINRTNPVGWRGTPEWDAVHAAGFGVAVRGERAGL